MMLSKTLKFVHSLACSGMMLLASMAVTWILVSLSQSPGEACLWTSLFGLSLVVVASVMTIFKLKGARKTSERKLQHEEFLTELCQVSRFYRTLRGTAICGYLAALLFPLSISLTNIVAVPDTLCMFLYKTHQYDLGEFCFKKLYPNKDGMSFVSKYIGMEELDKGEINPAYTALVAKYYRPRSGQMKDRILMESLVAWDTGHKMQAEYLDSQAEYMALKINPRKQTRLHDAAHLYRLLGPSKHTRNLLVSSISSSRGYFTETFNSELAWAREALAAEGNKPVVGYLDWLLSCEAESGNKHRFISNEQVATGTLAILVILFGGPLMARVERELAPVFLTSRYKRELSNTACLDRARQLLDRLTSLTLFRKQYAEANLYSKRLMDLLRELF